MSIGMAFDAVYAGFLGSARHAELVADVFDMYKTEGNIILADPAMGDNGRLYSAYSDDIINATARLCEKADIIVPNLTEAAFLLGENYSDVPYGADKIEETLHKLSFMYKNHPKKIIALTGISFEEGRIGAAGYDCHTGRVYYSFGEKVPGLFHGTGDIFASVLLSALLRGKSLDKALDIAVYFTRRCIVLSEEAGQERIFGVCFEKAMPFLPLLLK